MLTKSDLLSAEELASCVLVIQDDLKGLGVWPQSSSSEDPTASISLKSDEHNELQKIFAKIRPVSAATGAGIKNLWKDITECVQSSTRSSSTSSPAAVKEHYLANTLRKNKAIEERAQRKTI